MFRSVHEAVWWNSYPGCYSSVQWGDQGSNSSNWRNGHSYGEIIMSWHLPAKTFFQMSIDSDSVEGGDMMMVFVGKIPHKGASFAAEFVQFRDNDESSGEVWRQTVRIPDSQLHIVGTQLGRYSWIYNFFLQQHTSTLGGLYFYIPPYKNLNVTEEVQCYVQFFKIKNKNIEVRFRFNFCLKTF